MITWNNDTHFGVCLSNRFCRTFVGRNNLPPGKYIIFCKFRLLQTHITFTRSQCGQRFIPCRFRFHFKRNRELDVPLGQRLCGYTRYITKLWLILAGIVQNCVFAAHHVMTALSFTKRHINYISVTINLLNILIFYTVFTTHFTFCIGNIKFIAWRYFCSVRHRSNIGLVHVTIHHIILNYAKQFNITIFIRLINHILFIIFQIVNRNVFAIAFSKRGWPRVTICTLHRHKGILFYVLGYFLQPLRRHVIGIHRICLSEIVDSPAAHIAIIGKILFQLLIRRINRHIYHLFERSVRRVLIKYNRHIALIAATCKITVRAKIQIIFIIDF